MRSIIYGPDHEALRQVVRDFLQSRAVPNVDAWEKQRLVEAARTVSAITWSSPRR